LDVIEMTEKVWNGSPISKYFGSVPNCKYSEKILDETAQFPGLSQTWKCNHPESDDVREYNNPCSDLDWNNCPLNKHEKKEDEGP